MNNNHEVQELINSIGAFGELAKLSYDSYIRSGLSIQLAENLTIRFMELLWQQSFDGITPREE